MYGNSNANVSGYNVETPEAIDEDGDTGVSSFNAKKKQKQPDGGKKEKEMDKAPKVEERQYTKEEWYALVKSKKADNVCKLCKKRGIQTKKKS